MNNSLVTIIIPAFNCAKFISNAIESVLVQTYPYYELIVVDDGSIDNTAEVVSKYKNNLKYIYQKNGGVAKARNNGMEQSNGKYISFLDADDTWDKYKLDIQINIFQRHEEIDFIFSSFRHVKNNLVLNNKSYKDTFNFFREYKYDLCNIFQHRASFNYSDLDIKYYWGNVYKYLFLGNFILPSSVIFKKESLAIVGLLNENYRVAEETEYFLKFAEHNILCFVNYPLLSYEIPNTNNLSGKMNTERLIKNALKIQIDSLIRNSNKYLRKDLGILVSGISVTYCRLAYYYLSEYKKYESRKYAICGIKMRKRNIMAYTILLLSLMPNILLKNFAKIKYYYYMKIYKKREWV